MVNLEVGQLWRSNDGSREILIEELSHLAATITILKYNPNGVLYESITSANATISILIDTIKTHYYLASQNNQIKKETPMKVFQDKDLTKRQNFIANKLVGLERQVYISLVKGQYDSRNSRNNELMRSIQYVVRTIKEKHLEKNGSDLLDEKLRRYGNKGRYASIILQRLNERIYENKTIQSDFKVGKLLSVEIECIFPNNKSVNNFVTDLRKAKLYDCVTVKDDGSLRYDGYDDEYCNDCDSSGCDCFDRDGQAGKEVVVTFERDNPEPLKVVTDLLSKYGVTVNKTCGLHVHFDVRGKELLEIKTLGRRVAKCVSALKLMLPTSRRNNSYCQVPINKLGRGSGSSRYAFVNMQSVNKYGTIEIRGHSGTIDYSKIMNWIELITLIMNTRNTKVFSTLEEMLIKMRARPELVHYVLARQEKFREQSVINSRDDVSDTENAA